MVIVMGIVKVILILLILAMGGAYLNYVATISINKYHMILLLILDATGVVLSLYLIEKYWPWWWTI